MEKRNYEFYGNSEDLDTLEKFFGHMGYLGIIGASRNLVVRVDGDGSGRIRVKKDGKPIDTERYNYKENLGSYGVVGVYDIG